MCTLIQILLFILTKTLVYTLFALQKKNQMKSTSISGMFGRVAHRQCVARNSRICGYALNITCPIINLAQCDLCIGVLDTQWNEGFYFLSI